MSIVRSKYTTTLAAAIVVLATVAWLSARAKPVVLVTGGSLPEWTVDSLPLVTVGSVTGDDNHDLNMIRGAAIMSDTSLLVSNGSASDVRVYDSSGRFVRRYGGFGSGPKEYRFAGRVTRLPGGGVAVVIAPREYAEFDSAGVEIHKVRIETPIEHTDIRGPASVVLPSRGLLSLDDFERPKNPTGQFRPRSRWIMSDSAGGIVDTIWTGELMLRKTRRDTKVVKFSPVTFLTIGSRGLYMIDSGTTDLLEIPYNGGATRTIPLPFEVPNGLGGALPTISGHVVDDSGYHWLREYATRAGSMRWYVVDSEGRPAAIANLPPFATIFEIRGDLLLADTMDEYGVQRVQVYRLRRTGSAQAAR